MYVLLAIATTVGACQKSDSEPQQKKATVVLVHGAWQGAYTWEPVVFKLEQQGYSVVNVELLAHGKDQTAAAGLTMNHYRDQVLATIKAQPTAQVVLVGHSLGGAIISTVAEAAPTKISKLIYVAGFLPATQQSVFELAGQDSQSQLGPALSISPDGSLAAVNRAQLVNIFCQDGTAAVQQQVLDNYRDEPAGPPAEKVTLTAANYGRVPKYYVRTLQDRALSPVLQDLMLRATPVLKEYRLNSGHTPHLTTPDELSNIIAEIAQ